MADDGKRRGKWLWGALLALLLAVLAPAVLMMIPGKPPLIIDDPGVRVYSQPEQIRDFELMDHFGKPFSREELSGGWSLLFTGFLYCPDICPTTLSDMAAVLSKMQQDQGDPAAMRLVFISVDPFRDTPELIKGYVEYFNPDFLGVTGTPEKIREMTETLGLFYAYADPDTNDIIRDVLRRPKPVYYNVIHAASVLVVSPRAEVVARLSGPFHTGRVVKALKEIQDYYGE